MPTTLLNGNEVILQLDENLISGGTPDWSLVACETESGLNGTAETIDAANKCENSQLAGTISETFDYTGYLNTTPDVGVVSLNQIRQIFKSNQMRHWRALDINSGGEKYYREFYGVITTFNETSAQNAAVGFNMSIAINGETIDTPPVS